MQTRSSRAGQRSLAMTITALVALTSLAACTDEPVAPKHRPTIAPNAAVRGLDWVEVWVTNTSGGTEPGSLRWAAEQLKNVDGAIYFAGELGGKTITLDAGLNLPHTAYLAAPSKGVTISGKDQFRLITSGTQLSLSNVTLTKGYGDYGSAVQGVWLLMDHTTIQGNRGGPAIFIEKGVHMFNTTISSNTVAQPALFYLNGANVWVEQSTIANNGPAQGMGMVDSPTKDGMVQLRNSILANNGTENCYNTYGFTYMGANISSDWSCGEVGITVADPKLAPLANNGGPSMTHAISFTSPAYNSAIDCQWGDDQRYVKREAKCDVGAFEFNDLTKVTITIDPNVKVDPASGKALLTGTLTCSRDGAFRLALEVHQDQKVGKNVVDVHAASDISVTCGTTATRWSGTVRPSTGEAFVVGAAKATASTFQTQDWVTPASTTGAVKLVRAK